MTGDDRLTVWSAARVDNGDVPKRYLDPAREVLGWARTFLVHGHPELGRTGAVCPFTQPSLKRGLFRLAAPAERLGSRLPEAVEGLRAVYQEMAARCDETDRELLTILMLLPDLDPTDSTGLDELQRTAKPGFVSSGLMIGQFHPTCGNPGLWNEEFRPLRSPVPLLAVRRLLVFDLPFLVDSEQHLDSYLSRFAPSIPSRVRNQLVSRAVL